MPTGVRRPVPSGLCVICGDRGLADAVLNVWLFVPLGMAMTKYGWAARRSCLAGVLLSALIEFSQLFVPGRDPGFGDVLFNTVGVAVGILVVRSAHESFAAGGKAWRWSAGASLTVLAVLGLTAYALQPAFPVSLYYGQWVPRLGHLESYDGRVLEAYLGPKPIRAGRLLDSDSVRALLRSRAPWRVRAEAGRRVSAPAPLVSIYDEHQREIVLIGPDRDDLVYRDRRRAAELRLDQPDLRLSGALAAVQPGDTIEMRGWAQGEGLCLSVGGWSGCELGFTLGHGWALFLYTEAVPASVKALLNVVWLALLFSFAAFWSRGSPYTIAAGGSLLVALVALPAVGVLLPTPPREYLGACLGFGAGWALRRFLADPSPRVGPTAEAEGGL